MDCCPPPPEPYIFSTQFGKEMDTCLNFRGKGIESLPQIQNF